MRFNNLVRRFDGKIHRHPFFAPAAKGSADCINFAAKIAPEVCPALNQPARLWIGSGAGGPSSVVMILP
jgi:hypothetical protein